MVPASIGNWRSGLSWVIAMRSSLSTGAHARDGRLLDTITRGILDTTSAILLNNRLSLGVGEGCWARSSHRLGLTFLGWFGFGSDPPLLLLSSFLLLALFTTSIFISLFTSFTFIVSAGALFPTRGLFIGEPFTGRRNLSPAGISPGFTARLSCVGAFLGWTGGTGSFRNSIG